MRRLIILALTLPIASASALAPIPSESPVKTLSPAPEIVLSFSPGLQKYVIHLDVWVADGSGYTTGNLNIEAQSPNEARDVVFFALGDGFIAEKMGTASIVFRGFKHEDGRMLRLQAAKLKVTQAKNGGAAITALGSAKIETE